MTFKKGHESWIKGKHWNQESILKMRIAKLGNKHCVGRILSIKSRMKMSQTHKERGVSVGENNPFYNKQHNQETKKLLSKFQRKLWSDPEYKEKMKKIFKKTNGGSRNRECSKEEGWFALALQLRGIKFKRQKQFRIKKDWYHRVDFFIKPNLIINIDGSYSHSTKEQLNRDLLINRSLNLKGMWVIRISDKNITLRNKPKLDNIFKIVEQVSTLGRVV